MSELEKERDALRAEVGRLKADNEKMYALLNDPQSIGDTQTLATWQVVDKQNQVLRAKLAAVEEALCNIGNTAVDPDADHWIEVAFATIRGEEKP